MKTAMNKYLASFFFVCLGVLSRADAGPADVGREVVVNVGYENSGYRVKISAHGDSVTVEKSGAAAPTANLSARQKRYALLSVVFRSPPMGFRVTAPLTALRKQ